MRWSRILPSVFYTWAYDVAVTSSGTILVVGMYNFTTPLIVSMSQSGELNWAVVVNATGSSNSRAVNVGVVPNSNIFVFSGYDQGSTSMSFVGSMGVDGSLGSCDSNNLVYSVPMALQPGNVSFSDWNVTQTTAYYQWLLLELTTADFTTNAASQVCSTSSSTSSGTTGATGNPTTAATTDDTSASNVWMPSYLRTGTLATLLLLGMFQ